MKYKNSYYTINSISFNSNWKYVTDNKDEPSIKDYSINSNAEGAQEFKDVWDWDLEF